MWGALAGGLVPMTWFLLRFRPAWPIQSPAYLISGLVLALWIAYGRIAAVLAVRGGVPRVDGVLDAALSIGPLFMIDAIVVGLLVAFRRFRAAWLQEMNRRPHAD